MSKFLVRPTLNVKHQQWYGQPCLASAVIVITLFAVPVQKPNIYANGREILALKQGSKFAAFKETLMVCTWFDFLSYYRRSLLTEQSCVMSGEHYMCIQIKISCAGPHGFALKFKRLRTQISCNLHNMINKDQLCCAETSFSYVPRQSPRSLLASMIGEPSQ